MVKTQYITLFNKSRKVNPRTKKGFSGAKKTSRRISEQKKNLLGVEKGQLNGCGRMKGGPSSELKIFVSRKSTKRRAGESKEKLRTKRTLHVSGGRQLSGGKVQKKDRCESLGRRTYKKTGGRVKDT